MMRWKGVITSAESFPIRSRIPLRIGYEIPQDGQQIDAPRLSKDEPAQRGQRMEGRIFSNMGGIEITMSQAYAV